MDEVGDVATCAVCGSSEPSLRRPLFVVLGASGAGKTTIARALATELRGECAVFDGDWLIDPLGPQIDATGWTVLFDAWLHVAHGVAQSGLPTLVLGQLLAQNIDGLRSRAYVSDVYHLALVCDEAEQRRRLTARPRWRAQDADAQVGYATWLRDNIDTLVTTDDRTVAEVVAAVADWVRRPRP
jgi:gluconate kinase